MYHGLQTFLAKFVFYYTNIMHVLYYILSITAQNMANYGSQLRHFVRSNELVDNVDLADEANHEMFQHGDGDSWEPEVEDLELLDSDESENT